MKIKEKVKEKVNKKIGPAGRAVIPVLSAVLLVAAAVAYICLKMADEMSYREKWKDYDECGMH